MSQTFIPEIVLENGTNQLYEVINASWDIQFLLTEKIKSSIFSIEEKLSGLYWLQEFLQLLFEMPPFGKRRI